MASPASSAALLRGSCTCGRYQYAIDIPSGATDLASIIFDSSLNQRIASASPLSAFIRVPLDWYRSQTVCQDDTPFTIRRVFADRYTRRNFCGLCGTPISYYAEQPPAEAGFIQLTIGSLLTEDLHGLQDLGLLPESDEDEDESDVMDISLPTPSEASSILTGRTFTSIPWFDSLLAGSRLGQMHTMRGVQHSSDGRVRVEYEITEWSANDDNDNDNDNEAEEEAEASESSTGKRKRSDSVDGGSKKQV
ncbi:hypothetical protein F5Y18DRAFT_399922 [Xylariaceae sp. FL1019]|nr:hypothetical protein F5Y18DRAFT_399922 [Xylariaceae sp. FL1019]